MHDLEQRFEQEMVETVYRAAGRETGYWAGYFLRSVKAHGGVDAARRLLRKPGLSRGLLKLASLDRLDLAMESVVLREEFRGLFTEEERAMAERHLVDARAGAARSPS
jgi:5-methylcytosine-specific restriction protein A